MFANLVRKKFITIKGPLLLVFITILMGCEKQRNEVSLANASEQENQTPANALLAKVSADNFFDTVMNANPILPANIETKTLSCSAVENMPTPQRFFRAHHQTNFTDRDWQNRITRNWQFFDIPQEQGKVLVIDVKKVNGEIGFRYLANDNTHTQVYEPWSSAKLQAITGAIAKIRQDSKTLGATAKIGETAFADLITSVHSYADTNNVSATSNDIATFFTNIAGRDYLSELLSDKWLKINQQEIFFRGSFGQQAFIPSNNVVSDGNDSFTLDINSSAAHDKGYRSYTCHNCGVKGNKPMTSLAQAEWLKRLAMHDRIKETQHPNLTSEDINTLFYGSMQSKQVGGMMQGVSNILQVAIAEAISKRDLKYDKVAAKQILDANTQGQWRVFQKVGWGVSETRNASEHVVLAQVCLPHYQGGREFTVAAQVSVDGAQESNLTIAGQKMHTNLRSAMKDLLNHPSAL